LILTLQWGREATRAWSARFAGVRSTLAENFREHGEVGAAVGEDIKSVTLRERGLHGLDQQPV
jgi:hypothetical protein